jgi:bacteriocin-like protein
MKTLTTTALENVSGGASKSSELSTALTNIQSSIKDVANQKNNSGGFGDSSTMLMLGLMLSQKNSSGPTVVQAGAPAVAAGGPVVNISTRVRRGW